MSMLSQSYISTKAKAAFRPGKFPASSSASASAPFTDASKDRGSNKRTALRRNDSLPSPPKETRSVHNHRRNRRSVELEVDDGGRVVVGGLQRYVDEDEEEEEGLVAQNRDASSNPFRSHAPSHTQRLSSATFEHVSPTQYSQHVRKQRRVAKETIQFNSRLSDAKAKDDLVGMGPGWRDESNPFIDHDPASTSATANAKARKRKAESAMPERMTYVFRGKRIIYDVPLTALLSSEDPSESPYPVPSPRLLFPAAPPLTPPPPPSFRQHLNYQQKSPRVVESFLDALKMAKRAPERERERIEFGLPSPVREGRRNDGNARQ